jgi:hypothetical protein
MPRRSTSAAKVEPAESVDVYAETILSSDVRQKLDALLATVGLELASIRTKDAFWWEASSNSWLWVKTRRGLQQ